MEYKTASVDRLKRVLFLKYEDMKSNTLCYVKKLAEFTGKSFSKEEENLGVAEKIVARCHFESLSNLEVNKSGWLHPNPWTVENNAFFRKGEIGDWKNLLTEDMAKSIDHITQEKFQFLGLTWIPVSTHECKNNTKD
ncbi:flavonol sulfotransferase-like [Nicotiana tomentosiformis]|uniref:flavonol sulfotransferase-like n=1 Tax=Nicotiana tomentosiformis TaxID=4098 RepID=UPI00388CE393